MAAIGDSQVDAEDCPGEHDECYLCFAIRLGTAEDEGGVANAESAALAARHPPGAVAVRTLNMTGWYGGGIQHAKFLVADAGANASLLLGSSNFCDWRSLSQVVGRNPDCCSALLPGTEQPILLNESHLNR